MSRGIPDNIPSERAYAARRLARDVFLLVVALFAVAAVWTREYYARVVLAPAAQPGSAEQDRPETLSEQAQGALNNSRIVTTMDAIGLLPGKLRRNGNERAAAAYVRSRIWFEEIHPVGSPAELTLSYRSREEADAIQGANALAQSLTEPESGEPGAVLSGTGATIERELRESRSELRSLRARRRTASPNPRPPDQEKIAGLEEQLQNDQMEFASLEATRKNAQPAPPEPQFALSQAAALQQQIHQAEQRLAQLRQRYTEAYPDIADTKEQIAGLRAKLARIPIPPPRNRVEAPRPLPDTAWIAKREQTLAEEQQRLEEKLASIRTAPASPSQSLPDARFARAYASEQDRYEALLKARQEYRNYLNEQSRPLFAVVEKATTAWTMGPITSPLFWGVAVLCGLLSAGAAFLIARPSSSPVEPEEDEEEQEALRKELLRSEARIRDEREYRRRVR